MDFSYNAREASNVERRDMAIIGTGGKRLKCRASCAKKDGLKERAVSANHGPFEECRLSLFASHGALRTPCDTSPLEVRPQEYLHGEGRMAKQSDPVFTIKLQKGLADRHRLPVGQVVSVLSEMRQMIEDVGRQIQKDKGIDGPMDFGLELLADSSGAAFRAGSLQARIAITNNIEIGLLAAQRVLDTVYGLNRAQRKPVASAPQLQDAVQARIVSGLGRIAYVHDRSKAEAKFEVNTPKAFRVADNKPRITATFGAVAVQRIRSLREPVFVEGGISLYGKLQVLSDKAQTDEGSGIFWGELSRDNGERWRIQFKDRDEPRVTKLWRKQVIVMGTACYYQVRSPKLIADEIDPDVERDYEAAYQELFGCDRGNNPIAFRTLLSRRYGED
jgi:hypothetical protein